MPRKSRNDDQGYGIGAVAKLTGLTDHAIRVWERRYGAIVPERAANGRRIYTVADIDKLVLLKTLTDRGISIGQIAAASVAELEEQAKSFDDVATVSAPARINVAVLGDFLPAELSARDLSPLEILVADENRDRFKADLRRHSIDVIVVESAVLTGDTAAQLKEYMRLSRAQRAVVVYSFGRAFDVDRMRSSLVIPLRAPVNADDVSAAVIRTYGAPAPSRREPAPRPGQTNDSRWRFEGGVAPRRFNQKQLAALANTSTAIECECPRHLAQLVKNLSAFEIYSGNCASRDDKDSALHRYLHQTTAEARALIEAALERVAEAEDLAY